MHYYKVEFKFYRKFTLLGQFNRGLGQLM